MGGWSWDDEPPTPDALRLFQNARRLYDRIGDLTQHALKASEAFAITPELILEFHAIATAGDPDPEKPPGEFRARDNFVGVAGVILYQPPSWDLVPGLVAEMCKEINQRREAGPLNAAAYALWRINWIHPFGDGNGKTARAVMYLVLCVGFGRMLPGEPALPDLFAQQPRRYWDSLKKADKAWERGVVELPEVESLVLDLIEQVILE